MAAVLDTQHVSLLPHFLNTDHVQDLWDKVQRIKGSIAECATTTLCALGNLGHTDPHYSVDEFPDALDVVRRSWLVIVSPSGEAESQEERLAATIRLAASVSRVGYFIACRAIAADSSESGTTADAWRERVPWFRSLYGGRQLLLDRVITDYGLGPDPDRSPDPEPSAESLVSRLWITRSPEEADRIEDELVDRGVAVVPLLERAIRAPYPAHIRARLLRITAFLDPVRGKPLCIAGAEDESPAVREAAVEAMMDMLPDPEVHAALQRVVEQDASTFVRDLAAEALAT